METKPWWQSKTIVGAIVLLLSVLFAKVGLDVKSETLQEVVQSVMTILGFVLVIIGRVKANKRLRL